MVLGWGLWKVIRFRGGLDGWASCGRVSTLGKGRNTGVVTFTYVRTQWKGKAATCKPKGGSYQSLKSGNIWSCWHLILDFQPQKLWNTWYVIFCYSSPGRLLQLLLLCIISGVFSVLLVDWDNQYNFCLSLLVDTFILNSLIINFSTTFFSVRFHFLD